MGQTQNVSCAQFPGGHASAAWEVAAAAAGAVASRLAADTARARDLSSTAFLPKFIDVRQINVEKLSGQELGHDRWWGRLPTVLKQRPHPLVVISIAVGEEVSMNLTEGPRRKAAARRWPWVLAGVGMVALAWWRWRGAWRGPLTRAWPPPSA
ncbi:hypothetical protein [Micromonospora haikouensis]|uniref:hypothetical protein n=1 Tax=Micromonospora haikouensis TaxID=686309 RepID=UPI0037BCFBDA